MLEQASGTLEQVNGSSLVIKTPSGQPLTVTTTAATKVGESGALLGDITDGASVTVWGPSSDEAIAASFVIIANPAQQHPQPPPGMVVVKGTVADASTAGFTVVTSDATRVPVTTSSDTAVSVVNASLGQLPAGASILAIGDAGPDGTLSAVGVVAILQLPPGGPPVACTDAVQHGAREELLARRGRRSARRRRLIRRPRMMAGTAAARGARSSGA